MKTLSICGLAIGQVLAMNLWAEHYVAASVLGGVVIGVAMWHGAEGR